jgi:hypothetical protein
MKVSPVLKDEEGSIFDIKMKRSLWIDFIIMKKVLVRTGIILGY